MRTNLVFTRHSFFFFFLQVSFAPSREPNVKPKDIMLSEVSQTEKVNTVWSHLYVESKVKTKQNKTELIDTLRQGLRMGEVSK